MGKAVAAKRKDKYRHERKCRADFRRILDDYRKRGKIKLDTEWGDIVEYVEDHQSFYDVVGNAGSTPRDLFLEAKEPLIEAFEEDKNKIRKMMREMNIDLNSKTSFDTFVSSFDDRLENIAKNHLRMTYEYYIDKDSEEDERRERRKREKFTELLEGSGLKHSSTYEDAESELKHHSMWKMVNEPLKKEFIKDYLEQLKKKRGPSPSDADAESKKEKKENKEKKEKKRKRSRSSSGEKSKKKKRSESEG